MPLLLEVIVQTVADARAAAAGGAHRLEVVRDIAHDGLTPSIDVVRAIRAETGLPLRVMVRKTDSFTVSDPGELAALRRATEELSSLGVDGIVLGFARGEAVDLDTTRAVLADLPAVHVTFHRAFDVLRDPLTALDALRELPQIDRVLTSGGSGDWTTRCEVLARYAAHAGETLTILAGAGIDDNALALIAASGCVREAHVGRAARDPQIRDAPVSIDRVRRLRRIADRARA